MGADLVLEIQLILHTSNKATMKLISTCKSTKLSMTHGGLQMHHKISPLGIQVMTIYMMLSLWTQSKEVVD